MLNKVAIHSVIMYAPAQQISRSESPIVAPNRTVGDRFQPTRSRQPHHRCTGSRNSTGYWILCPALTWASDQGLEKGSRENNIIIVQVASGSQGHAEASPSWSSFLIEKDSRLPTEANPSTPSATAVPTHCLGAATLGRRNTQRVQQAFSIRVECGRTSDVIWCGCVMWTYRGMRFLLGQWSSPSLPHLFPRGSFRARWLLLLLLLSLVLFIFSPLPVAPQHSFPTPLVGPL